MTVDNSLIKKFIDKQTTPEEERLVKNELSNYPELLHEFMTENSWKEFNDSYKIQKSVEIHSLHRNQWRKRWLQAAIFLGIIVGVSIFYFTFNINNTNNTSLVQNKSLIDNSLDTSWIKNDYNKDVKVVLPDETITLLHAHSKLYFLKDYNQKFRNIFLQGSAKFQVHKNKLKPFIVFNKGVSVTALGTIFSVNDYTDKLIVRLYEGKISVKQKLRKDSIVLFPSQSVSYNYEHKGFGGISIFTNAKNDKLLNHSSSNIGILSFNQISLEKLFKTLESKYAIHISFNKDLIENKSFTGQYNSRKEGINAFLNDITDLNNLKVLEIDKSNYTIVQ